MMSKTPGNIIVIVLVLLLIWSPKTGFCIGLESYKGKNNTRLEEFYVWSKGVDISTKAAVAISTVVGSLVSMATNSIIIHSVRVNRQMHTTTNYFVVNMACADLFLAVFNAPYNVKFIFNWFAWFPGPLGHVTCAALPFSQYAIIFCSIFSMVMITFDRFMAVSRPVKYKSHHPSCKYLIATTWGLSILLASPLMVYGTNLIALNNGKVYCISGEPSVYVTLMVAGYILPLGIITVLCLIIAYKLWTRNVPGQNEAPGPQNAALKTSKRVTCMIIAVVLAFCLTWAPVFIVNFIAVENHIPEVIAFIWPVAYSFIYFNGSFNVVIYYIFSENYRSAFRRILSRMRSIFPFRAQIITENNDQQV